MSAVGQRKEQLPSELPAVVAETARVRDTTLFAAIVPTEVASPAATIFLAM